MKVINLRKVRAGVSVVWLAAFWLGSALTTQAERVTAAEARVAAQGWVNLIERIEGHWGPAHGATVSDAVELVRDKKVIGYYCPVKPGGYVVVVAHKELLPVTAFATSGRLDPAMDVGMADLVKVKLHGVLKALERSLGPLDQARPEQFQKLLKTDYRINWQKLNAAAANPAGIAEADLSSLGGRVLLSTEWNQPYPYNAQCPTGCPEYNSHHEYIHGFNLAGCGPVAQAQIMRFWSWPRHGNGSIYGNPYDWANMPTTLSYIPMSPQVQIDAVAELIHEIGVDVEADYGCNATYSYLTCLGCRAHEDSFPETFYYNEDDAVSRGDYSATEWFNEMKAELNCHQPMMYSIPDHIIVVDGWMEMATIMWYHINYGWGKDEKSNWFVVDAIPGGNPPDEERLKNLCPARHIGPIMAPGLGNAQMDAGGTYIRDWFPYLYFNVDAQGTNATIPPGMNVQFLPTVKVNNCGVPPNAAITFRGSSGLWTYLYANGDFTKGAVIRNGTIKLKAGGTLRLVPQVPPRYIRAGVTNVPPWGITVSWERGYGDDEEVIVERKPDRWQHDVWEEVGRVPASKTSFDDMNVPGQFIDYSYRLRSVGHGSVSAPSDVAGLSQTWP